MQGIEEIKGNLKLWKRSVENEGIRLRSWLEIESIRPLIIDIRSFNLKTSYSFYHAVGRKFPVQLNEVGHVPSSPKGQPP